jgi:hypothetical protein
MNWTDDQDTEAKILDRTREQLREARLTLQKQFLAGIRQYDRQYSLMRESLNRAAREVFAAAEGVYQTGEAVSGLKNHQPVTRKKRRKPRGKNRRRVSG